MFFSDENQFYGDFLGICAFQYTSPRADNGYEASSHELLRIRDIRVTSRQKIGTSHRYRHFASSLTSTSKVSELYFSFASLYNLWESHIYNTSLYRKCLHWNSLSFVFWRPRVMLSLCNSLKLFSASPVLCAWVVGLMLLRISRWDSHVANKYVVCLSDC